MDLSLKPEKKKKNNNQILEERWEMGRTGREKDWVTVIILSVTSPF